MLLALTMFLRASPAWASWKSNDQNLLEANDTIATTGKISVDPMHTGGDLALKFLRNEDGMMQSFVMTAQADVTTAATAPIAPTNPPSEAYELIGDVCLVLGKSTTYTIRSYNPKWMVKACWAKCFAYKPCVGFDVSFDSAGFSLCTIHEGAITGSTSFNESVLTNEVPKNPPVKDTGVPNAVEPPERALGCYRAPTPSPTPTPTAFPTTKYPTPAPTTGFYMKYKAMWPHCRNIACGHWPFTMFMSKCSSARDCTGFSYTAGNPVSGHGCLKRCGTNEPFAGYGHISHGYWATGVKSDTMKLKYSNKWPHCRNINCGTMYLNDFKQLCQSYGSRCTGFSYPRGNPGKGFGCTKACGHHEFGGYGYHSHGYWSK